MNVEKIYHKRLRETIHSDGEHLLLPSVAMMNDTLLYCRVRVYIVIILSVMISS